MTCRETALAGFVRPTQGSASRSEDLVLKTGVLHTSEKASSELKTLEKCRVTSAAKSCEVACAANSSFSSLVGSRKASVRYAETMFASMRVNVADFSGVARW